MKGVLLRLLAATRGDTRRSGRRPRSSISRTGHPRAATIAPCRLGGSDRVPRVPRGNRSTWSWSIREWAGRGRGVVVDAGGFVLRGAGQRRVRLTSSPSGARAISRNLNVMGRRGSRATFHGRDDVRDRRGGARAQTSIQPRSGTGSRSPARLPVGPAPGSRGAGVVHVRSLRQPRQRSAARRGRPRDPRIRGGAGCPSWRDVRGCRAGRDSRVRRLGSHDRESRCAMVAPDRAPRTHRAARR